jgi:tRNA (cmo5U34)-methyltransferase
MQSSSAPTVDAVGDGVAAAPGGWTFKSESVAAAFDKHVAASVPAYDQVQRLVARLSTYFVRDGGVHLDWGCSTGRTIVEVARANPGRRVHRVGVDESREMVRRAADRLRADGVEADLRAQPLQEVPPPPGTCLITALYTLQFLPPAARREALAAAAAGLEEGGALVLVEKVLPDDPGLCAPFQDVLWDEKRDNGYSAEEVAGKARSLRGVLRPLPAADVERALESCGLRPTRFWQYLSFAGWVAVRR